MSMISHEISWWDYSVVQVIQVMLLIQVMQVRLAHLWPDFRVILEFAENLAYVVSWSFGDEYKLWLDQNKDKGALSKVRTCFLPQYNQFCRGANGCKCGDLIKVTKLPLEVSLKRLRDYLEERESKQRYRGWEIGETTRALSFLKIQGLEIGILLWTLDS